MGKLIQELKRRNVFRVGVAYVVVAWLIIQVVETVSEPLGLPDWTVAFFIVLLLAGFPLILLFSWAFELTPEGLKKTEDVDRDESVTASTGKRLNYATVFVLVLALGYFIWERQTHEEPPPDDAVAEVTQTEAISVAVLPFVNMSADPNQEYFSDGISEELLNLLAKIPEVRVPARTSSFQFKGQNLDIGEVAEQLNVKHVLEGSVRKADVRVRITAQLIEAETGYHLWSDTYDRELTDIFAIQDEISAAIVAALSDTLGLSVAAAPSANAAADSEAYNLFLLAQHQLKNRTKQDLEAAIPNYERALELDPDYAPAHAGLGLTWYLLTRSDGTYGTLPLNESLAKALPHLERALEIDPELPEALGAMGLTLDARERYEEALPYFEKALQLNPSLTDVRNWYSNALGALGREDDAFTEIQKAYEMDPLSVLTLNNYTNNLLLRRSFDKMDPVLDRLTQIDPARGMSFRGWVLVSQGRAADGAASVLNALGVEPENIRLRTQAAMSLYNLGHKEAGLSAWPFVDDPYELVSFATDFEGQLELARQRFEKDPDDVGRLRDLAWANWEAGNKEEGLELINQYLDTVSEARRPVDFANMMLIIDAWQRGDQERVNELVAPLEALLDQQIASGVDFFWVHLSKALMRRTQGDLATAHDHMERAAFRSIVIVERFGYFIKTMGLDEEPQFVALQERHRDYMNGERDKLLAMACGPDGFSVWQPSAEECGQRRTPIGPN